MRGFYDFSSEIVELNSEGWNGAPFLFTEWFNELPPSGQAAVIAYTTICLFTFIGLFVPIAFMLYETFEFRFLDKPRNFFRQIGRPKQKPRIAYKKAFLEYSKYPNRNRGYFRGVTGTPYGPDSYANRVGFHAYEEFTEARKHPQEGNVILEVLLSGTIDTHEKGYIATHQRVLQVILDNCFCGFGKIKYFIPSTTIRFGCKMCMQKEPTTTKQFFKAITGRALDERAVPIDKLSEHMPWLKEQKIVIADASGPNKFVPTVL